jgi:hypothetical protein
MLVKAIAGCLTPNISFLLLLTEFTSSLYLAASFTRAGSMSISILREGAIVSDLEQDAS